MSVNKFSYSLLFCCLFSLLFCVPQVYARNITISVINFNRDSQNAKKVTEIISEAYNRLGHHIDIIELPSVRSLITANSGHVDGELFRVEGVSIKYENLIKIPVPIATVKLVAFSKNSNISISDWKSLIPYKIAYPRGLIVIEQKISDEVSTVATNTYVEAFKMLDAGWCDVVLGTKAVASSVLEQLRLDEISTSDDLFEGINLFHYVHKKNQALVAPLTRVLLQMKEEGFRKD